MTKSKRFSYLARAALASAVLYFALDRSHGDRHAIDWTVIGLVAAAIAWNLVQLGRRLHHAGGGRALWHLQRTALFWIGGLLNTALLRPENVGTWRNTVGWVLLAVAAIDTIALGFVEHRVLEAEGREPANDSATS